MPELALPLTKAITLKQDKLLNKKKKVTQVNLGKIASAKQQGLTNLKPNQRIMGATSSLHAANIINMNSSELTNEQLAVQYVALQIRRTKQDIMNADLIKGMLAELLEEGAEFDLELAMQEAENFVNLILENFANHTIKLIVS